MDEPGPAVAKIMDSSLQTHLLSTIA